MKHIELHGISLYIVYAILIMALYGLYRLLKWDYEKQEKWYNNLTPEQQDEYDDWQVW